jgi:hypothetical protein
VGVPLFQRGESFYLCEVLQTKNWFSVKKERIKENFDVLFELSPQDMKELEALDKNIILNHQKEYWGFNIHA